METQNGAIISAIRKKPGISRSELTDVRCNGFRIANVTARISECRWILMKTGETIVCSEGKPISVGRARIRTTTYRIIQT